MRLHLPVLLFRSLLTCFAAVAATTLGSLTASAATYPNGSITYTTRQTSALTRKGYESILFQDIIGSSNGGAICNYGGNASFTLSGNGDVTFSGNTASSGGAIYNYASDSGSNASFTLSGNGDVTFSGNTASSGGAIYNYASASGSNATFSLSGNVAVTFSGNTASDRGGAIYNYDTFTLSDNAAVTFSGNTASAASSYYSSSAYGGAIYNSRTFTLSGNEDVTFSGNTASSSNSSSGGAIYNSGTFTLSGNVDVMFSGNTASSDSSASSAYGGAIYNTGTFTLSGNVDVTFSGNTASSSSSSTSYVRGGAIYNSGTFTLSDNGAVTFSGNTASSKSSAYGGAIVNSSNATFTLSGNGAVTFSGNTASKSSTGGAIYNSGTFTLSDNGVVTFSGNTASISGGAISNSGTFTLSGNEDVIFEKNAEISDGSYRLRSIYSTGTLNLSAAEGKSILFKDSVCASGTVNLNQDGTGDIIFTGATTETDLRDVKGGIDGTASEILNSRTSELVTLTNLYGGRLIVENGAVLKVKEITTAADSGASVVVRNATLNDTNDALTFNAGTALVVEGESVINVSSIKMNSGSSLHIVLSEENKNAAALTLNGTFSFSSGASIIIDCPDLSQPGTYKVLTLTKSGSSGGVDGSWVQLANLLESDHGGYWSAGIFLINIEKISSVTWKPTGTERSWDTSEKNWLGKKIHHSFEDGINVRFGNDGYGVVTLSGTLAPRSVIIANDKGKDYIFEGTGQLSGSMRLTKSGAGNLTLNIGNTYSGGTLVQGGTLVAGTDSAFGTGSVTLAGCTLNLNSKAVANTVLVTGAASITGGNSYAGELMLMGGTLGGEALNLAQTATLQNGTVNIGFSGAGAVQKTTAGTVTLNAASTYSGGTLLSEGTLVLKHVNALGTGALELAGGTLDVNSLSGTLNNAINGAGGLSINNGSKTLTLNGISSYSGGTRVQGGTLVAGNASAFGTGAVTLAGGTLNLNGKAVANTVQVTGSASITGGSSYAGTLMLMGGTLGGEALNLTQTADLQSGTVNSSFSGAGSVQKTSLGTVTLNSASSYSGGTSIEAGTLIITNLGALGAGSVTLAGGELCLSKLNGTFTNALTGRGILAINNEANTLILNGANNYSGETKILNGTLVAGHDAVFSRSKVTLAGGTLDMNRLAANNTLSVTGTATLHNANRYTGQLVLDGGSLSGTALQLVKDATLYSGSIANNMTGRGGVIKEGTGTATLSGLNTYSGETVINEGTLALTGMLTSNIRLNEKGTLNTGSGMQLAFNQRLTMAGGDIEGDFFTGAGSNLVVQQGGNVNGSLTFGGGCVTLNNQGLDNTLRLSGTLNLSEKTELKLVGYDTAGTYYLATYDSLQGSLSNLDVSMAFPEGSRQMAALSSSLKYLVLTITGDATVLNWRGGSGEWETLGSAQWGADSWVDDKRFHAYDTVVFDRGGSLSINGTVLPKEVQVSGSAAVSFSGSGRIGGESTLLKEGSCELTLNAANSYTGGSTLRGGSVKATGAQSFGTNRIWLQSGTLNLNGQAVSNAVTASGGSISGGSAYAGELTVDGRVSVSGSLTAGAVNLLSGTLTGGTLTDTTVYATSGSIESSFGGYSELVGNNYALQSAVSNTGTLRLSGIFDLSGMTPEQSHTERVDFNGNTGTSGFTVSGSYNLRLVNGGKIDNAGAVFLYNGSELSLNANGTVGYTGATDYSTYYMQKGDTLASSAIHRTGAGAAVNMAGGSLTADDAVAVTAQGATLRLQGGSITGGTLTDCTVNAVSGSIRADISGNSTMTVSGNVRADGALQLNALTLQSGTLTADIATADVIKLTVGQGALDGALTLNGGSVTFGGNTLSVSGQLALVSSTALDVSAYTKDGTYTLIAAGSFTGDISKQLSIANESSRYGYTLLQNGNKLNLQVEILSEEHTWTDAKGTLSGASFAAGDSLTIGNAAAITISGELAQGGITVTAAKNVTLAADKKTAGSRIGGDGAIIMSGSGTLTLNAGNTYSGGTELNAGTIKATAADSFGSGVITVKGGTLDLASKAVTNDIVLSGTATLKGDAKYAGNVTVEGKATLLAKTSYKSTTTIGEDSSLTLGAAATMAGNVALEGGTLIINNAKGMTLAKNQTLTLDGGTVKGLVTVGAGGTLAWQEGSLQNAPVLKGGTLDLGGKNALTLTGVKAQVQFGDKVVELPGKGIVRSDETLDVLSGTVKLTMGKETTDAAITVSGNAALVNGATHSGDITVDGTLAKGTTIKLIDSKQTVELNGKGTMAGTISGVGSVNVNESIDATAAKLTAANISLNGGTFTNTKGIKLVKGQTLTLNGANVNLGAKGILTTAAGSTLKVSESATLSGSLTLGGGDLVFEGAALTVKGTLTLSKPVSVTGSGTLICDSVKPFKGDLSTLFGGADVTLDGTTLTINGGATKKSLVAAPVAEEEAPLVATPALPTLPEMPATNPVADAIAQADWGILDANRAFTGAVATRHQHAALLDKGRGAAWVSAFGASVRHGNQGSHHGSDGNIEGAALGMEHSVSETGVLGLAVGRSKNRIGATGVTHLRQETAHVALYGQKQFKHNLTADATAAWGDTETKLGGSSWQQKSAALSGRLTHAHMVNNATAVRTFGGLSYEATESGSFGADSRSGSVQNLRAELGAGAAHTAGKAHFYGEASLTGDLIRHNPSVELGGLRHHGATPGRLGVKATMGAFYSFTDTWTGTASYSVEAESRTTSHTLNVGVSKQF